MRRSTEELTAIRAARRPATAAARAAAAFEDEMEGPDTSEIVVRATHVEAPGVDEPELEDSMSPMSSRAWERTRT